LLLDALGVPIVQAPLAGGASTPALTAAVAGALRTLGDRARVEDFRERARKLIRAPDLLGVDLTKIRLTPRGIERRAQ
jgi:NAD(P)H-dependent flavin oxidoreductase YrpB (nitropropane dioxygenase family)